MKVLLIVVVFNFETGSELETRLDLANLDACHTAGRRPGLPPHKEAAGDHRGNDQRHGLRGDRSGPSWPCTRYR